MDVGPAELLIVMAVALLLFGSKKLPELARSVGAAKREFELGAREGERPASVAADTNPLPSHQDGA